MLDINYIQIIPFTPQLSSHFYQLNAEWLEKYFTIEPIDHEIMSHPEQKIIAPGGAIFFAQFKDDIVGTCALKQDAPGHYELTKMAVTENHQGMHIGKQLLQYCIDEFQYRHGKILFLETNSRLTPAIHLYKKMGFVQQSAPKPGSLYQRADVYMIWQPTV